MEPVAPGTEVWRFGPFELDLAAAELRKGGTRVKMQDQPWRVLVALVENGGRIVTREELRARLWPDDTFVDFDHGLNIAINKIRDALGDEAARPRFVETVPRRGYRFIAPLERIASPPPEAERRPGRRVGETRSIALLTGAIALAVVLIAAFAVRAAWWAKPPLHVIAVLPLRNLNPEAGTDYFTDGLTDEIIDNLSTLEGLEVKSRSSAFHFKGSDVGASSAGRQLGADVVLEGTVSRAGGKLRLSVHLVRTADDVVLWSEQYSREMAGVFEIQDEIARAIVNGLRLKGIGGRRRYNTDLKTYDLYLRALSLSNENAVGVAQGRLDEAIELLRQVTTTDPGFAPGFALTAEVWGNLRNRGRSRESTERMREAAGKAIELDPLLPAALASLGLVHSSDLRWKDAESDFLQALALDPSSARTRVDFARFVLFPEGRTEDGLAQLFKAVELDPLSTSRRLELGQGFMRAGAYEQAFAIAEPIFAANPANLGAGQMTARALMLRGKTAESVAIFEKLSQASHGHLGYAYALLGQREKAEAMAAEADPAAARHQLLIYTALGDADRAFAALREMVQAQDYAVDWFPGDPELAPLRDDPRMTAFRRERGLPTATFTVVPLSKITGQNSAQQLWLQPLK